MISDFENLGLQPDLVQAVAKLGYESPTAIQLAAIPALLAGRSVLGQAQTGTGKTAAFALPMLQRLEPGRGGVQALVLAPTRELAIQVAEATAKLAGGTRARVLPVYGGQSYEIQIRQLKRGVDVVVGTPGRLMDLMRQKVLDLSKVQQVVLDEADEMLEMGFVEDVETILAAMPDRQQMALFSATLPDAVRKLAGKYLTDPQVITVHPERRTVAETEQRYCRVNEDQKLTALARMLETEDVKSALIFARTRARTQELADALVERGIPAESLHGDLGQSRREFVLNRFRRGIITILVATDVAARGLDIDDVSHVFNYDIPADSEDYIHRIGRTGRAGRKGVAISFVTTRERFRMKQIETGTRQPIPEFTPPNRAQLMARREQRFMDRLTAELGQITNERALVLKLAETGLDAVEIAAAAIRMARSSESPVPAGEITAPAPEQRRERSDRKERFERSEPAYRSSRSKTGPAGRSYPETPAAPAWQPDSKTRKPRRDEAGPRLPWEQPNLEPGMVRLHLNLGVVNGLRPGDVVGAIAGEVGIPGRAIGAIDIRQSHSFVDVAENHVRKVLKQSAGNYLLHGQPVLLTLAK